MIHYFPGNSILCFCFFMYEICILLCTYRYVRELLLSQNNENHKRMEEPNKDLENRDDQHGTEISITLSSIWITVFIHDGEDLYRYQVEENGKSQQVHLQRLFQHHLVCACIYSVWMVLNY